MSVPLRTLHLIDGLGTGGAERSLAELLPALPTFDIEPTVVVRHRRAEGVEDRMAAAGVDVLHVPGRLPRRARVVRAIARDRGVGLLHSSISSSNHLGRLVQLGGPPLLTSLVNTPFAEGRVRSGNVAPWKLEVVRLIERATAPTMTAHFHALTEAVADHAVETIGVPRRRITVVPRGRDGERLGTLDAGRRRRVRDDLGLGPDELVVVNVGRREPQKGQWVLLEALALLRDRGLRPTCLVVGRDGSASSDLDERVERLGLTDQVRFLGHRDDVPDLLVASDVFAFPSFYEGFGGAVIEAMALEVPVVAGDCPAVREVLARGDAGTLVPTGEPDALADALERALGRGPDVRERVTAAADRFRRRYTHEAVVRAMAALFHEVADRRR